MVTEKRRTQNRDRGARYRENNRDKYNAYTLDYMNRRNARIREHGTEDEKAKARKQNTDKCRRQRHRKRAEKREREAEETRRLIISEGGDPLRL